MMTITNDSQRTDSTTEIVNILKNHNQSHLIDIIKKTPPSQRGSLEKRVAEIDWADLSNYSSPPSLEQISPSRVIDQKDREARKGELEKAGVEAYKQNQVAVLLVAGGQGSRLGYDGPKGCYPLAPVSRKSLYQIHAEKVLSAGSHYNSEIPLVIMTSGATDSTTRSFFAEHNNFNLKDENLIVFSQGTVPTCSLDGKALLCEEGKLLENPDGHGGCYQALLKSGTLDALIARGIKYIVYIQVDNILAPVNDPVMVGLLKCENSEMITKVLPKVSPTEKVGNLVNVNGKDKIVEYTEINAEEAEMKDNSGEYLFRWGSPAMHAFSVSFFSRLRQEEVSLPFHRSKKPVMAWIDGKHREVQAYKNEKFIFDLIPLANNHLGLAIERDDEFAPCKNAEGTDSPETAIELLTNRNQRWLEQLGFDCSSADRIEIDPLFASTYEQLAAKKDQIPEKLEGNILITAL